MKYFWICFFILIKSAEVKHMFVPEDESLSDTIESTSEKDVEVKVHNGTRHAFFRDMDVGATPGGAGSRRVFGGTSSELKEFPTVSALLDRYLTVRCTATILNKHWVLTAAHCVTPRLAYVKYNTRRPASNEGSISAIHYLYRHPKFVIFFIKINFK